MRVYQLPHNHEAEQIILGGFLIDEAAFSRVSFLVAEDFFADAHKRIFNACKHLYEKGAPIDLITVTDRMKEQGDFAYMETPVAYCAELMMCIPTAASNRYYANILLGLSARRQLMFLMQGTLEAADGCSEDHGAVFGLVDKLLHDISRLRTTFSGLGGGWAHSRVLADVTEATVEAVHAAKEGRGRCALPTGWRELDGLLGGWRPGELTLVAGRPGHGKTTFALNAAYRQGRDGKVAAFFSCEMKRVELGIKLIAAESGVDGTLLAAGKLTSTEYAKMTAASAKIEKAAMFIHDAFHISIQDARSELLRLKAQGHAPKLVVFDYIQIMKAPGERRYDQVSNLSGALKGLAFEFDCHVMALSQLSRAVEQREDKRPMLADLRESGALEQDADNVIFVYRPGMYGETTDNRGKAEIIIAKQRNGKTGATFLAFDPSISRFSTIGGEDGQEKIPF